MPHSRSVSRTKVRTAGALVGLQGKIAVRSIATIRDRTLESEGRCSLSAVFPALQILVVDERGVDASVILTGELDEVSVPELDGVIRTLTATGVSRLTLDIAGLELITSAGIDFLVAITRNLRDHSGDVVIRKPSPQAARLFEIVGLSDFLTLQH
jgi:anti-anti-sigma factor